jgi:hypothetical protein
MKRTTFAALGLAVSTFLSALAGTAPAPAAIADPPTVTSLATLRERELKWGLSHQEVADIYNGPSGLLDREYAPQIARLQPGVEMQQLEADRDARKANFQHAYSTFDDSPSGYDVTPLHSEYTYKNDEGIQRINKDGRTRYFFYIKDKLWKIYDEMPLKAGGPLGDSYAKAVAAMGALLGAPGRSRGADPAQQLDSPTTDWQDLSTHLRLVDRSGERLVGVVLEDRNTLSKLASLRTNKPTDPFALDPSIAAITKNGISDPNAAKSAGMPDAGATKKKY